jgi:septal ring factor EnvC (AmiA/AmiB activator)
MSTNPEVTMMEGKKHGFERTVAEEKSAITRKESEIHHLEEQLKKAQGELLDLQVKLRQAESGVETTSAAIEMKKKQLDAEERLKHH